MKVLLINGSPRKSGCTARALSEIRNQFAKNGIDTKTIHIGTTPIGGCIACGKCKETHLCVFGGVVNEAITALKECDALIVGSPVYYASANGSVVCLLDRMFYAASCYAPFKPAAAIVSARRAGTTATIDELNKYFSISQMPIVPSCYWNMVHGNSPEDVEQDEEGLQIMRTLANNMSWLMKSIEAGKAQGITLPEGEPRIHTNFISRKL